MDVFIDRIIACNTGRTGSNHAYFLHIRFSEIRYTIFDPLVEPITAYHTASLELLWKQPYFINFPFMPSCIYTQYNTHTHTLYSIYSIKNLLNSFSITFWSPHFCQVFVFWIKSLHCWYTSSETSEIRRPSANYTYFMKASL